MSDTIKSFKLTENGIDFHVNVVLFGGAENMFWEQWEGADTHKGGETITNPNANRNDWKYFRPLQTSLAKLTADYAKQGLENPSREAYDSLQRQLIRDIDAGDYGFIYSAKVGTEWITTGETCGFGFDWSYEDGTNLEDIGRELFRDCCLPDAIENVAKTCHELVQMADQLRGVAKLYTGAPPQRSAVLT